MYLGGDTGGMIYRELITEARRVYVNADASSVQEHVAIQFDVTGNAHGIFYLEIAGGHVHVEPYNYYDHDAVITGSAEAILDLLSGKESLSKILMEDRISVEGYYDKVERLNDIKLQKESR